MHRILFVFIAIFSLTFALSAQHDDHDGHDHADHAGETHDHGEHHEANACGYAAEHDFNVGETAFHHVADQNVYNIGPLQLPLPGIFYSKDKGLEVFSTGKFHADSHGTGEYAYNGYVLYHGLAYRVTDSSFPSGHVELGHHAVYAKGVEVDGKEKEMIFVCHDGEAYPTDGRTTLDAGYFGGAGFTSFMDFSITKNVVSMLLAFIILALVFGSIAKSYKTREGQAPRGLQGLIEPVFVFIRDEVAIPFLGHKYLRYFPFLMSLFFFILGLNLWGQIPFLGGSNVTGNLAFTMALAVITFLVVNLSGNKHYWEHTLWMPGVPAWVKVLVLTPVEIAGLFIKPLTLMLRLAANITAGHIVVVVFISLIFIFGKSGELPMAAAGTSIGSVLLTLFMMAIELLVAFIQAFVFTILTASYIGAAVEEPHHH